MVSVTGPAISTPACRATSMSYLMFWPTFSTRGIGQDRLQSRRASRAGSSTAAMHRPAHRHVIGLARLPAERQADQVGPQAGRSRSSRCRCRTSAAARSSARNVARTLGRVDQRDSRPPRRLRPFSGRAAPSSSRKPWKPHSMHRARSALDVRRAGLECLPVELERQVVAERHQPAGAAGRLGVLAQALLLLRALDLVDVREQVVERAELLEERRRRSLRRCPGRRDVVRPRPRSGPGNRRPGRGGCPSPFRAPRRRGRVLAQVENADVVGDELAGVLVGRADKNVQPALLAAAGEGGDHVVGLHRRLHQTREPEIPRTPGGSRGSGAPGRRASPPGWPCIRHRSPTGTPGPRRRKRPPGSRASGRGAG